MKLLYGLKEKSKFTYGYQVWERKIQFFQKKDRGQAAGCLFTSAEFQRRNKVLENYKTSKFRYFEKLGRQNYSEKHDSF